MPPIRTKQSQNVGSSTTKQEHKKRRQNEGLKESAPLGVSKIKSALRQTRRLLAKEGIGADVRLEAERKLKALEADLVVAERTNKERALATRYHKVKFFDRQKLLRKIRQTKRRLEDEEISSKVRKALKAELFDLRVDLNYVMNYPKLEKYISLYPPEVRSGEDATPVHSDTGPSVTNEKREKLREWVRGMMRAGEMSNEPETLEYKQAVQKGMAQRWEVSINKNKKAIGAEEEELKARHDMDAPDDFFEEDDTGNENSEAEEPANTRFSESPSKRRPDKAENHPDKHSKQAEKDLKKARRKKDRKVISPAIIQDSFFGDESG
ncbi:hypothetical protein DFH94DRAFT_725182 [Russula ochroleuca]|uniref:rRNA-processing protein EFG1 n=1 Tax=Russula ochroleuca TaxID=152965 RepID=A0A9P5TC07_9AGAM|nr:hypothetical protein DFH94DRAFT_725182 [Russula ochroleuca]